MPPGSSLPLRISLPAFLILALAGGAAAQTCADPLIAVEGGCRDRAAVAEGVRSIVETAMADFGTNAAIVRISIDGRPIITEAWGESIAGVPATPDMHFRNGAIAIAYMTTVLLQLHEQGVLSLDDPLATWLPDLPRAGEVTLRMLADNTSGYADYVDLAVLPLYENVFRQWAPDELIARGLGKPMACDPGACFQYAHTNYVILGEAMARASGRSMAELIREGVLAPLGLNDTRSEDTAAIQQPVLHAFTDERGRVEDSTYWSPSWTLARGAIMTSSIHDVERSAVAIGTGRLVSEASQAELLAGTTIGLAPGLTPELYYGLGVIVNNGWIIQTPSFHGYAGAMAYEPTAGIAVAIATTNGAATTEPRPAESLLYQLGAYLSPDIPPRPRGG